MNFTALGIHFLSKSARAMSFAGCIAIFLGLNISVGTSAPLPAETQGNASVTGSNSAARTAGLTIASQPATNTPVLAPIAGMPTTATNLSQTAATNSAFVLDDKYKLGIGDRLSFRILEDEDDPKPLFVTDSGDIEVPYIGRVPAVNKTCRQLAAEIKTSLEKDYYYQATVIIAVDLMARTAAKSPGRVYLVGAVRLPGPVELPGDEVLTLSRAILRGGGFTDYADRRHVKVTRKDTSNKEEKKTFVVDVGEIFDKGKIESDLVLEPGDLIFVPDRLIRF
jgi:polysaccharide export outer membrane protein